MISVKDYYKDAIVENPQPVVLAHGIHSDLNTWKDFAEELAFDEENARDAWLIEMYGGPTTDADCKPTGKYDCPVYTFDDLKYYYWPALVAGIQQYSGENNLSYVGYDLGCTVALESLENYSNGLNDAGYYFDDNGEWQLMDFPANPVDTFVAVTCMGNFQKLPLIVDVLNITGPYAISIFRYKDSNHIGSKDFNKNLLKLLPITAAIHDRYDLLLDSASGLNILLNLAFNPFFDNSKMSLNIYEDIIEFINTPSEPSPGENISIPNFLIVQAKINGSWVDPFAPERDDDTDIFVPIQDQAEICNNIQSNNKWYVGLDRKTHKIIEDNRFQEKVRNFLSSNSFGDDEGYIVQKNDCNLIGG